MNKSKPAEYWQQKADLLRATQVQKKPPLKIREVMDVLGYESTGAVEYALTKMQELGLVVWVSTGDKGEWYLV